MNNESIEGMLKDLMYEIDLDTLRYGKEMIQSFNEFYKERGFLSEKQQVVLRKIYRGHIG